MSDDVTADMMATELLKLLELMSPMEEAVRGYKAQLLANDWPEAEATAIATDLLIQFNRKAFA